MFAAAIRALRVMKPLLLPRTALPLDPAALATGAVLAFDAALAKTGWAVVQHLPGRAPTIEDCGLITTHSDRVSHEQTLARAQLLHEALGPVVDRWADGVDLVACERPAVAGMRIESSLMAMREVHRHVGDALHLVSRQHAVRVFCGPAPTVAGKRRAHTKAESKAAVLNWVSPPAGARFNADIADATLIALTALYDRALQEAA